MPTTDRSMLTLAQETAWVLRLLFLLREEIRRGVFGEDFDDAVRDVQSAGDTQCAPLRERCEEALAEAYAAYHGHQRACG